MNVAIDLDFLNLIIIYKTSWFRGDPHSWYGTHRIQESDQNADMNNLFISKKKSLEKVVFLILLLIAEVDSAITWLKEKLITKIKVDSL